MGSLANVPMNQIRENKVALRAVNKEKEEYLSLRDAIQRQGVLSPVSVRRKEDQTDGSIYFELIDGLHRFTACKDLGLPEIPAHILDKSDVEVLEAQIIANAVKVETRPVEYTQQLLKILAHNPTLTLSELAGRLSRTGSWLQQRMSLLKLADAIKPMVDDGRINLSNAYALSKLPQDEQPNFVDQAISMSPAEFTSTVQVRAKELREANRKGDNAGPAVFQAAPHLRQFAEIRKTYESKDVDAILAEAGAKTAKDAALAVLAWAVKMDPVSVAEAKAKYEERLKEREEARARAKAERDAKKQAEGAEAAVAAGA